MSTALTGAAGEHYVAFQLSLRGFCVGLSRGGSPYVDIIIANATGEGVAIQVKTSRGARRQFKRSTDKNRWEFDVGPKARTLGGGKLFYAFVDLKWENGSPDVFIVPSLEIRRIFANTSYPRTIYWLMDADKHRWFERWDYITEALKPVTVSHPELTTEAAQ
jgi:hypothetical protein